MNMRSQAAEKPVTCAILKESDVEKTVFGNMRVKTFYSKFGDDIDEKIDEFLNESIKYVISLATTMSIDGTASCTRIVYRTIIRETK
jgi:hypothetical protein